MSAARNKEWWLNIPKDDGPSPEQIAYERSLLLSQWYGTTTQLETAKIVGIGLKHNRRDIKQALAHKKAIGGIVNDLYVQTHGKIAIFAEGYEEKKPVHLGSSEGLLEYGFKPYVKIVGWENMELRSKGLEIDRRQTDLENLYDERAGVKHVGSRVVDTAEAIYQEWRQYQALFHQVGFLDRNVQLIKAMRDAVDLGSESPVPGVDVDTQCIFIAGKQHFENDYRVSDALGSMDLPYCVVGAYRPQRPEQVVYRRKSSWL